MPPKTKPVDPTWPHKMTPRQAMLWLGKLDRACEALLLAYPSDPEGVRTAVAEYRRCRAKLADAGFTDEWVNARLGPP